MKKNVFGRQFKRDVNERKALFKNLLTSLVLSDRIKTTEAKAKAIKGAADKLVTKAKNKGEDAYKSLHPDINEEAVVKMIKDIAPRFADRQGGYTRIIKIGKKRVADNAPMVYLEWTVRGVKQDSSVAKPKKVTKKVETEKVESASPKLSINKKVKEKINVREVAKKQITRQKKGQ